MIRPRVPDCSSSAFSDPSQLRSLPLPPPTPLVLCPSSNCPFCSPTLTHTYPCLSDAHDFSIHIFGYPSPPRAPRPVAIYTHLPAPNCFSGLSLTYAIVSNRSVYIPSPPHSRVSTSYPAHAGCPQPPPSMHLLLSTDPRLSRRCRSSTSALTHSSPSYCSVHEFPLPILPYHWPISAALPASLCPPLPPTLVRCPYFKSSSSSPALTHSSPSLYAVHHVSTSISGYPSPPRAPRPVPITPTPLLPTALRP